MDYPKSVPSVGLVGGKFVDEDAAAGTQGSLIPAQWGNAVTQELLNVIAAAGLQPDEEDNAQLAAALGVLVPAASEAAAGKAKLASQAQVTAGADDLTIVTPLKLAQRLAKAGGVVGMVRNARMVVSAASATATLTADEVVVKAALGGASWLISGFNKPIDLTKTGAGGMDVGAAPATGYVGIYAIYNPTSGVSSLLAVNATAAVVPEVYGGANMPAGYTASALASVWPTNSSGQLKIGAQRDRAVVAPSSTAFTSSVNQSAFASISIASVVPPNTKTVSGYIQSSSTSTTNAYFNVASDANGSGLQGINGYLVNTSSLLGAYNNVLITVSQTLFYQNNVAAGTPSHQMSVTGFTF